MARSLQIALCALLLIGGSAEDPEVISDAASVADFKEKFPDASAKAAELAKKSGGGGGHKYLDCRAVSDRCECYHPDFHPMERKTYNSLNNGGDYSCRASCQACRMGNDACITTGLPLTREAVKAGKCSPNGDDIYKCNIARCNSYSLGYLAINQPWFADSPMRPIVEKHMADSAFLNFTGVDRHELSREIVRNIDNTEEIILTFEQKPNVIWGIDTDQGVTETITDHLIKKTKILQDKHTRVWDYEEYFDEKPLGAFVFFHIDSELCGKVAPVFKHAEWHLFRTRTPWAGTGQVNCKLYPDLCKAVGLDCAENCADKFPVIHYMQSPDTDMGGEMAIRETHLADKDIYQKMVLDWYIGINTTLTNMIAANPRIQEELGLKVTKNEAVDDSEFEL